MNPNEMTADELRAAAKRLADMAKDVARSEIRPSLLARFATSDRWRMVQWLVLAAALVAGGLFVAHPQIQTLLGAAGKVAVFAWLGYWVHRHAHRHFRPDEQEGMQRIAANLCKAAIIVGAMIAGALALP